MNRPTCQPPPTARRRCAETTSAHVALGLDLGARQAARDRCLGFTLIELMISLLVLVVLLAIGIPSFRSLATQDRITSQTNEMLVGLQLARSEAIRQRTTVSFCSSANGTSCDTEGPYWTSGWVVLRGGQPIRVGEAPHTGLTVSVTPSGTSAVLFDSAGAASPSVSFEINSGNADPRCIRVLVSGFIASEKLPCPTPPT